MTRMQWVALALFVMLMVYGTYQFVTILGKIGQHIGEELRK